MADDNDAGQKTAAPRNTQTTLAPPKTKGRITILGPTQAIRVTYPSDTGGAITDAFAKQYKSSGGPPNDAAQLVGAGQHKYGSVDLPLFEEPSYTDFGKNASSGGGTALVIGNKKYDVTKKMGSTAIQNRIIDAANKDADKMEGVLKATKFSVKKLYDQKGGAIAQAVADAAQGVTAGKCFVFYFCGHGTFDGLIGTDGAAAAPSVLIGLIPKAIVAECDLVIILDACHQGFTVDAGRTALFDVAKQRNDAKPKMLAFLDAAKGLAAAKDQFNLAMRSILEEQWRIEAEPKLDTAKWQKHYNKRSEAWNTFIGSGQALVDQAVKTRNAVTPGLAALTLEKCPPTVEQDEEKKIWAQLDSIDIILNQAVSGQLTAP